MNSEFNSDLLEMSATCAFSANKSGPNTVLERNQALVLPFAKRLQVRRSQSDAGEMELHLDYGEREISFDEPALFGFAEGLASHAEFLAGEAMQWGGGYEWSTVKELLEMLLEEGILQSADQRKSDAAVFERYCPSPLPPAQATQAHSWLECEELTRQFTGRALELGYLEAVIPIYRVAHPLLDQEERQVGEGNVFPKMLRLDIPTDWRICQHAGSRYQDELPMNVTALKTMRKHWGQCMQALLPIRQAYLKRFPQVKETGWTVGDLQRLSTLVLTLPAYLQMKANSPLKNGELHPVLSNLFRITDGARMALHYQLFMPVHEPTLPPDAAMNADELYQYAERNNLFLSDYGVCAGPRSMIEEFLRVLVDGDQMPVEVSLDDAVQSALNELEPALNYELLALRVHAVANVLWPLMIRAYEQLNSVLSVWPGQGNARLQRLRASLREKVNFFRNESVFNNEAFRCKREAVLEDMFRKAGQGLGLSGAELNLFHSILPAAQAHSAEYKALYSLLHTQLFSHPDEEPLLASFCELLMRYFLREQGIVREISAIQQQINQLLGRAQPSRPFLASDINLYFLMQDGPRRLPYLVQDEINNILNIQPEISAQQMIFSVAATSPEKFFGRHRADQSTCDWHGPLTNR